MAYENDATIGRPNACGLAEGSMILTLRGAVPVETLRPGDKVVTRSGARKLTEIAFRTEARARLVRISASALGHDRPEQDIVISADQPILMRDWRAKVLTGADRAMIPATRLVDGEYIRHAARRDMRLYTLHFDTPAVIYAQGLELGCEAALIPA